MANTDSFINVVINSETVDKIGLSAALTDISEIQNAGFCGMYNNQFVNGGNYDTLLPDQQVVNRKTPLQWSGSGFPITLSAGNAAGYNFPDGQYGSIVWLYYIEGDNGNHAPDYCITQDNINKFKLVTEWDAPHYVYYPEDPGGSQAPMAGYMYDSWNATPTANGVWSSQWGINFKRLEYWSDNEKTAYTAIYDIYPYQMYVYDGKIYLLGLLYGSAVPTFTRSDSQTINFSPYNGSFDKSDVTAYSVAFIEGTFDNGGDIGLNNLPYTISSYSHLFAGYTQNKKYIGIVQTNSSTLPNGDGRLMLESYYLFHNRDDVYKFIANAGLKFYTDKLYKPVISNKIVIGYTDNMGVASDLDTWQGTTNHNVNVVPPHPGGDTGDFEIDMPLAYIGSTAGMVDFIRINEQNTATADDIADALSRFDITTIGKDLLRNFVAFKCYAVLNITDSVVRDIKVSGHTLKNESDNALQGEYIGGVSPVDFSAGRIEPLFNDFRDYAPYTHIQMYVPFCGWFDLPSWCMGKEITGTMFTDLYNGTVKAVIYASRTVVAEVGGCCAFDIPFAAESTGMKAGAVISSALNTVAMTGATIAAPNIATGIAAVSSAANFISAANANGTTLKGVMGDGSNTNGLLHVYIKVTRPNSPTGGKEIPDKYKHEYGIPCYKELKLTAGDGYTQILDANIEGDMTDREKQMIIDGFRHGLIL